MIFILDRTNDKAVMSYRKIFGLAALWLVVMFMLSSAIIVGVSMAYKSVGISPEQLTQFGGDVSTHKDKPLVNTLLLLLVIAPVVEEIIFRLGLSFRRQTVALWAGLLPVAVAAYLFKCYDWMILVPLVLFGAALYWLVMRFTTDAQWPSWRSRYLRLAMWVSVIAFGLIHLKAFTVLTWALLPYCLALCLRPGLVGCVITYARVNMGFWWGVLFHILNNIPAVLVLIALKG
jgi:hypothetical protein